MKTSESDALARLLDGDPAAADDAADELRSLASLAHAMEARATAPRPEFRDSLREALFAEAMKPVPPTALERVRMAFDDSIARFKYSARAAAATTAAAMTLSTGGVAVAATHSVPGDLFYPIKVAVEDARLGMADDAAARGERLLASTSTRIDEAERAAEADRDADAATALDTADESLRAAAGELISAYQDSGDRTDLAPLESFRGDHSERLAALSALLGVDGTRALAALETSLDRIDARIAAVTGDCCVAAAESGERGTGATPGVPPRGEAFDFAFIPRADEPFEACPCPAVSAPVDLPTIPDPVDATPAPAEPPTEAPAEPAPTQPPVADDPDPADPPREEPSNGLPVPLPTIPPLDDVTAPVEDLLDPARDAVDPVRDAVEDILGAGSSATDPLRDAIGGATEGVRGLLP